VDPLVECVPNFSEGRDRAVIDAIAAAIRAVPGVSLLDVDPGASTNRTVYTFVGSPEAVVEGALAGARAARQRIDMRTHAGEHPRLGALDVCPFVPVADVTLERCVACAREFGRRAADELGIPVYLYEAAQDRPHRKTLRQIRAGEYEGLRDKLSRPEWAPDFGPTAFVPEWGATVAGARFFLIAYNVNVLGTREQAHRIALDVREQGRGPDAPGMLKAVKAIGWFVEEYGLAQVSMNLDDYRVTPPHAAFEACRERAAAINVGVAGSELVGLIPRGAVLAAAEHYIEQENLFILDERQRIRLAIERLGLASVSPFDPDRRIIEYLIDRRGSNPLADGSVAEFVEKLGARSSAPGGGSAAALMAAMGAALGAMVGWLLYGRRQYESVEELVRASIPTLDEAMRALVPMIDEDTRAFARYMAASKLPKGTAEEQAVRQAAMQDGLKTAIEIPLRTMRLADRAWDAMLAIAPHCPPTMRSDLEVGTRALESGVWGCHRNVLVNLDGIEDAAYRASTSREASGLAARAAEKAGEVLRAIPPG
jgi:glutamate formiminotransferase/formiminotetrahydrofolate cyclodeaminase